MSVEDDLFKKLRRLVENTRVVTPMRMKVRRPPAQARRRGRSRRSRRRVANRGASGGTPARPSRPVPGHATTPPPTFLLSLFFLHQFAITFGIFLTDFPSCLLLSSSHFFKYFLDKSNRCLS